MIGAFTAWENLPFCSSLRCSWNWLKRTGISSKCGFSLYMYICIYIHTYYIYIVINNSLLCNCSFKYQHVPVKCWRKNHGQAHGDDMGRLAPRKEAAGGYLKKQFKSRIPWFSQHSNAVHSWDLWSFMDAHLLQMNGELKVLTHSQPTNPTVLTVDRPASLVFRCVCFCFSWV